MRRSTLQRPPILHQRFNCKCLLSTSKSLRGTFRTLDNRNSKQLFTHISVLGQHVFCILKGTLIGGMGGMSLLPQKLGCTQKGTCAHLPPHDIRPLIHLEGQVTMTHNPLFEHVPNHCFRCRSDNQWVFQLGFRIGNESLLATWISSQSMMSHHRTLLGKSINMLGLLFQKALWNQQGEVGIFSTMFFDACIEIVLNTVPE
mmetsp:Transcript_1325/g.2115  ORF Transcript_1325/g.2115 Transcript_1325/m.2115 type:complete len:201 (+) Transcript_1325:854-1456(+)